MPDIEQTSITPNESGLQSGSTVQPPQPPERRCYACNIRLGDWPNEGFGITRPESDEERSRWYCGADIRSCRICGNYFPRCESEYFCRDCRETSFRCENCGGFYENDEYATDGECRDCQRNGIIRDHSARPTFAPLGSGSDFLGAELELEVTGDCDITDKARETIERLPDNFAIVKDDGSLSNGFEICTRPASLEEHRKAWDGFFTRDHIRGMSSFNTGSCGLHIHASKAPLSELSVSKIVCFVNHPKNRRFVQIIAGRNANLYCAMKPKRINDGAVPTGDKYEAVNLNHSNTLEFRIFKGTLKKISFFKALEFVSALVEFVRSEGYTLKQAMSHKVFCMYVRKNRERWPLLDAFITLCWKGKMLPTDHPALKVSRTLWPIDPQESPPPPPPVFHN